ncbi:RNA-directed DNA polymerase from mobile element jockey [Araneus ventricosus]|uniref:RNA-directed DNA polymerase from mobile element jockey n=1 Tax=Araneus ventricosus TaxID=182803 RepID=A0A4Y2DHK6_ARAVE|nr:RNA-directed DNA polymerase from mobile element jockey [Araneus ventricosus]
MYPEFTVNEVKRCIGKMKRGKAPGEDGFSLEIIEEIFYADRLWFVEILNYCLRFGYFPRIWKESRIVLIPKAHKDLSSFESYMPICLLAIWGKLLDKLITHRLVNHLETNNLLNERQYGFRENLGTITALKAVNNFILIAKNEKQVTCKISLDIKNAFNSIKWADLINLLKKYRTPSKLLKVFNSFLKDRTVILNNGDRWNYNIGVPQGSSSGPILWLLVANEVLELFSEQENLLVHAFADDFIILLKASTSYRFTELSKEIMLKFEAWATKFNLVFSENKSRYIMFKVKKTVTHFPGIHLYGKRISYANELKYLGIVFDPNNSFMIHLDRIQEKNCAA